MANSIGKQITNLIDSYLKTQLDKAKATQDPEAIAEAEGKYKCRYTYETYFYALHIRIYAEQVGCPADADRATQIKYLDDAMSKIRQTTADCGYYIDAALHYADHEIKKKVKDAKEVVAPDLLKVHVHLIAVSTRPLSKGSGVQAFRLGTLLNYLQSLIGFRYNFPADLALFCNNIKKVSLHKVAKTDLPAMIAYQRHNTFDAKEDGKHLYDPIGVEPFRYSNDPNRSVDEEAKYLRYIGYERRKGKIVEDATEVKLRLYDEAYDVGVKGESLKKYLDDLDPIIKINPAYLKVINDRYKEGADKYLSETNASIEHTRCCIYIEGAPDMGKTHNAIAACMDLVKNCLDVSGGHSGKLDNLTSSHKAIVFSDVGLVDYLGICDDRYCYAYKRMCNNPLWCGDYLVITYNSSLDTYLQRYAPNVDYNALKSRLYICTCDEAGLHLHSRATRGTRTRQNVRDGMFIEFMDKFNEHQQEYIHGKTAPIETLATDRLNSMITPHPNDKGGIKLF